MFEKNGSMSGMQSASTFIFIIHMISTSFGVQRYIFLADRELVAFVSHQIHYLQMIISLKTENTEW